MSRPKFSGRIGFVLSAAGSAVGLGNIWRFPYLAAEYGGGIFLLCYIVVTLLLGFPIMAMEIAIGRRAARASIQSYRALGKGGAAIGALTALITLVTLPYYCVIGGWVVKYAAVFVTGAGRSAAENGFYSSFISGTFEPVLFQLLFLAAAAAVVMTGVKNGIEKANKVLMPVLVVLAVVLAVYSLCADGAAAGAAYYLRPDFSKFSFKTILAATGQMFYSLSLSSGIIVTYGAYLEKSADIERSVKQIEIFDIGIAFLSGLTIICALFAFSGGEQAAVSAGAGLMFETMPAVFAKMPLGQAAGAVFFVLVLFAALTSAISMMEVNTANLIDLFGLKRPAAAGIMAGILFLLGLPSALGYSVWSGVKPFGHSILDFLDIAGNSVVTPIAALLACVYVGWVIKPSVLSAEISRSGTFRRRRSFEFTIKYTAPVFIAAILLGAAMGI
ncbi:MAG: sodium-dependent transporter [Oscillospiraceae bacterium]